MRQLMYQEEKGRKIHTYACLHGAAIQIMYANSMKAVRLEMFVGLERNARVASMNTWMLASSDRLYELIQPCELGEGTDKALAFEGAPSLSKSCSRASVGDIERFVRPRLVDGEGDGSWGDIGCLRSTDIYRISCCGVASTSKTGSNGMTRFFVRCANVEGLRSSSSSTSGGNCVTPAVNAIFDDSTGCTLPLELLPLLFRP